MFLPQPRPSHTLNLQVAHAAMLGLRAQQEKRDKAQVGCGFGEGLRKAAKCCPAKWCQMQSMVISMNLNKVLLLKWWDMNA